MQSLAAFQSEHRTLRAENGRLHADIWRLGRERDRFDLIKNTQQKIEANERRMRTIEYLIRWMHENQDNSNHSC